VRAWLVDQFGEPESMRLAEIDTPPADGRIRIRVRAAGVNFFDLLQIRGQYQSKPAFPFTPGAEICGEREDTGERVIAFCAEGGYAEHVAVPSSRVFAAPESLDDAEAAAFLIVYHTAWFVLSERARLREGEWLLVHAGASGAGMSAIQVGAAMGAQVIATAGSEEKRAFARSLGALAVFDYAQPNWFEDVKHLTGGRGVDVIYDPVGGDVFDQSSRCIAMEGRLVIVGFTSGRIPSIAANRLLLKNISAVGAVWGSYMEAHPGYIAETQAALAALVADGVLKPTVGARYAFDDAPRALRDLEQRKVTGKAVLVL
jgi:NADPH2:quinone reductase